MATKKQTSEPEPEQKRSIEDEFAESFPEYVKATYYQARLMKAKYDALIHVGFDHATAIGFIYAEFYVGKL